MRRLSKSSTASASKEAEILDRLGSQLSPAQFIDMVEEALIELQVVYHCHLFHSTVPPDSATWITILTQDMSVIPYRSARIDINESICMEAGQVRAGADNRTTFQNSLQQLKYFSPALAGAVVQEFGNIHTMMRELQAKGPDRLLSIGSASGKRAIGKTLAKNLHFIFASAIHSRLSNDILIVCLWNFYSDNKCIAVWFCSISAGVLLCFWEESSCINVLFCHG